jgi:hypothetical protein
MTVGPYLARLLQIRPQYTRDPDTGNHPENVTWWVSGSSGVPTLANLISIAGTFDTAWSSVFTAYGGDGQYLGSQVTDFSSSTGLTYSSVGTLTPVTGGHGSDLPPNVAALISIYVGERYRGGHPRIYLPYVGQSSITGSTYKDKLDTAIQTAIATAFTNLQTAMSGSGVLGGQDFAVLRKRRVAGAAFTEPMVDFTAQALLASQRRRLRKAPHH